MSPHGVDPRVRKGGVVHSLRGHLRGSTLFVCTAGRGRYCTAMDSTAITPSFIVPLTVTFQSLSRWVALRSARAFSLPAASNLISFLSAVQTP